MKKNFTALLTVLLLFVFVPKSLAADDIKGHWAEKELRALVQQEIMTGYPDGSYQPDKAITRAEFAKLIMQTLSRIPNENDTPIVSEVPVLTDLNDPEAWYYADVEAAVEQGIITGFEDGTFKPQEKITREQMASMIMRAIQAWNIDSEPATLKFKDTNTIQKWALDHVQRIVYLEIMNGMDGNIFAPAQSSTRAQVAAVLVRMQDLLLNKPEFNYTTYNFTLDEMIQKQMAANPQTDKYRYEKAYVISDYIKDIVEENGKKYGTVYNTDSLNYREGPGTNHHKWGPIKSDPTKPTKLEILNEVINEKNETWYEVSGFESTWRSAKQADVAANVDPKKFATDNFQFLVLSKPAGATAAELNSKILVNNEGLAGKGQSFIDASKKYSINEIYLVAHAQHETANGKSLLAKGITVESIVERDSKGNPILDEQGQPKTTPVPKQTVYNVFGIGAYDVCANQCGAERAYKEGWFTIEDAIIGGAKYISEDYINNQTYKQDTLYKMRWNPGKPATHQYATDIGWATKQVNRIQGMYLLLDSYSLSFDIPVYK